MKKFTRMLLRIAPVVLIVVFVCGSVFGFSTFDPNTIGKGGTNIPAVNTTVNKIWGSVLLILQILAVAAIVLAGVRFMFASADQKAEIKKQLIVLVVGAVLVFAASTLVQFLITVTNEVTT